MPPRKKPAPPATGVYASLVGDIGALLETARRASARSVNALMTATYWEIGRRIVEFEQGGAKRAGYGERLIERLSDDLTRRFGRGFGQRNVECMRQFFLAVPQPTVRRGPFSAQIPQTLSAESEIAPSIPQTLSAQSDLPEKGQTLPAKSALPPALPDEKTLSGELEKTRRQLESRRPAAGT
jgi:hypothetical protein